MPFQYTPTPYVPQVYQRNSRLSELLLRQGEQAADAQRQQGAAQAQLWSQLGQGIQNTIGGVLQAKRDEPRREMEGLQLADAKRAKAFRDTLNQTITATPPAQENGLSVYDLPAITKTMADAGFGADTDQVVKHLGSINEAFRAEQAAKLALVKSGAQGIIASGNDPTLAAHFLDRLEANGTFPKDQVQQFREFIAADPGNVAKLTASLTGPPKIGTAAPGSTLFNESTGATVGTVPDRPRPATEADLALKAAGGDPAGAMKILKPTPQTANEWKDVLLDGKPAKVFVDPKTRTVTTLGGQTIDNPDTRIKPVPTQASVTVQQGKSDAESIADAIESGAQPPTVQGLYRLAGPVRAELSKRGYDMTKANMDWEATKKHLNTLNGAQQTRLRQAISTASDSLGVIEDLAKQWDGGKFPLLNKAQLSAAKAGALGPQAQQIATNLEAQITDVTSELGNVYMGGNSPTDHALGLAQKNLSADWTKDQLLSAIKLARTNLQIRNNSITNSGAVLSGGSAAPAAAPSGPTPTMRFNPATGKVEPIKPGGL